MSDPRVLVIASIRPPKPLAASTAARVSVVSPLWLMAIDEGPLVPDGVRVAVLARNGDLDGHAGVALDGRLAEQPRVQGRAAGDDNDPIDVGELEVNLGEVHDAVGVEAAGEGGPESLGLLVDLLEHKVLEPAELDVRGVPIDLEGLALDG